jgi:hypothetical protein
MSAPKFPPVTTVKTSVIPPLRIDPSISIKPAGVSRPKVSYSIQNSPAIDSRITIWDMKI